MCLRRSSVDHVPTLRGVVETMPVKVNAGDVCNFFRCVFRMRISFVRLRINALRIPTEATSVPSVSKYRKIVFPCFFWKTTPLSAESAAIQPVDIGTFHAEMRHSVRRFTAVSPSFLRRFPTVCAFSDTENAVPRPFDAALFGVGRRR